MARRLIGTGITNAQGIAIMNKDAQGETITGYTGVGAGKLQIVAESGTLQSEIYELEDCYWIERTSPTSGMYSVSGGTLTIVEGAFTFTKNESSSYFYLNIPKTSLPIADFIGKTLIVKTDITSINANSLRMGLFTHNGTSWDSGIIKDMTTTGLMEQSIDIPFNSTQVRIRFDLFGNTNDTVSFKDFRLLWG